MSSSNPQQRRQRGNATAQKGPGAHNRRFKTKKPGTNKEPPVYSLRVDLTSVLWQADNEVERCPQCHREFGFFRRMHHCRSCGLIYCDDHCQEDDDHDNERVCVPCMSALQELNDWAKQEFADRLRRAQEASALLDDFRKFDVVEDSRKKILDDEVEARLYLMDNMRESQRAIAADIRDKISSVVGNVSQMERRRTRPVYGPRKGVLRLRVQRARNLQPVKKAGGLMSCNPHVVIQVGTDRQKTNTIEHDRCGLSSFGRGLAGGEPNGGSCANSVSHDFSFEEVFVFDVDNDKDGVLISLVDHQSIPGVPVLLGIAYLNIRRINLIEADVDWNFYDTHFSEWKKRLNSNSSVAGGIGGLDFASVLEQNNNNTRRGHHNNNNNNNRRGGHGRNNNNNDDTYEEETSRLRRQMNQTGDVSQLLAPGGEYLPFAKVAKEVKLSPSAASILHHNNNTTTNNDQEMKTNPTNNNAADQSQANNNNNNYGDASDKSPLNVMRNKSPDDFLKFIERGNATRALCDFDGQALSSAQIFVSWSFHPYKPEADRVHICAGCRQQDAPGFCFCGDHEKEEEDEKTIKQRLRDAGGEIHSIEMNLRTKYSGVASSRKNLSASGSPLDGVDPRSMQREPTDFGMTPVPILRPKQKDKVETCCC